MLNISDILRVFTDTIILSQLTTSDSYGYAINKNICKLTNSLLELKEATLYTSFRRLEESGYIDSYWGNETGTARRRYYTITQKGRTFLKENKTDWKKIKSMLEIILN